MAAPVNEGNIIVGSGKLYKLFFTKIIETDATANTIQLATTPTPPTFENNDVIRVWGIHEDDDGELTVTGWDAGTRKITVAAIATDTTNQGYLVSYARGESELGGTEDGAEIVGAKEYHDVEGAEAPVTLRKELTSFKPTLNTNLLESTLDNLLLNWPGATSGGTLTIGTDGETTQMGLKLVGKAPQGDTRTYMFWRTVSIGDGGHRYTKGANTIISTEFEMLPIWDYTNDKWIFGTIVDA